MLGLQHRLRARNSLVDLLKWNRLPLHLHHSTSTKLQSPWTSCFEEEVEELPPLPSSPSPFRPKPHPPCEASVEAPLPFNMPSVGMGQRHKSHMRSLTCAVERFKTLAARSWGGTVWYVVSAELNHLDRTLQIRSHGGGRLNIFGLRVCCSRRTEAK